MALKKDSLTGISYEVIGDSKSRETLLFIHGAGGNKLALRALAEQFREYNCILVDLPGHNLSDGEAMKSVSDYAAAIEKLVESCKEDFGDHLTCVGHSMGGTISLELAVRKVVAIERLVILNSGAKLTINSNFMRKVGTGKIDKFYMFRAGGSYFSPRVHSFFLKNFKQMMSSEQVTCADMKAVSLFDRRDEVKDIKLPTFIVTGSKEILAIPEYSEYLHSQIQGSRLLIMKGLSHLMPIVIPEKLAREIKLFFNSKPRE